MMRDVADRTESTEKHEMKRLMVKTGLCFFNVFDPLWLHLESPTKLRRPRTKSKSCVRVHK